MMPSSVSPVDKVHAQVPKAIKALLKLEQNHASNETENLLSENSGDILIQITTLNIPKKLQVKPVTSLVPRSLYNESTQICVFVKDNFEKSCIVSTFKNIKTITVTKLKKNYKAYEQKRLLCASYDLFLADEAITALLPPLLGKTFFDKKKVPIPVDFKRKVPSQEITRVLNSVYMIRNKGVCNSVKVAKSTMTPDQIQENITHSLSDFVKKLGGWENIQAIHLKTNRSIALPVFNQVKKSV